MSNSENEASYNQSEILRNRVLKKVVAIFTGGGRKAVWLAGSLVSQVATGTFLGFITVLFCGFLMAWATLAGINAVSQNQFPHIIDVSRKSNEWVPIGQKGDPSKKPRISIQGKSILTESDVLLGDKRFLGMTSNVPSGKFVSGRRYYVRIEHRKSLPAKKPGSPPRYPYLMAVEVRHEIQDDGSHSIIADVGCFYLGDHESTDKSNLRRIPWWKVKSLATSAEFMHLKNGTVFSEISFPTTPGALCSWVRSHWKSVSEEANPHYGKADTGLKTTQQQIETHIANGLEAALEEEWGSVQKSGPVITIRIINGLIQLLIFTIFWAILVGCICRWITFVLAEKKVQFPIGVPPTSKKLSENWLRNEIISTEFYEDRHINTWGVESASHRIWETTLRAILGRAQMSGLPEFVNSIGTQEVERRENSVFLLRFFLGAMPALGFLGTVWGIGTALMGTGSVLSDELAKQQSGVSIVALSLGVAFDTTFVALLLTLIATLLMTWLSSREQAIIEFAQDETLNELFSKHGELLGARPLENVERHEEKVAVKTAVFEKEPRSDEQPPRPVTEIEVFVKEPSGIKSRVWIAVMGIRCLVTGALLVVLVILGRKL